jgi:hypothetical protein
MASAVPPTETRGSAQATSNAQERFQVLAVLASNALRRSGSSDLVEAGLARLPGVRIVDREHLDAITGELSASELLGPDSAGKRLKLGRLVKADALVILAEEERAGVPVTTPAGAALARVVISDCSTGARLFVGEAVMDAGAAGATAPQDRPPDFPAAVADAVTRTRTKYPLGVKWVIGTSPFVNRGLTYEYDGFQDRFAALLDNALSMLPGVAVLEIDEARSIGKEQAIGGGESGAHGTDRVVPLMIEGDFQIALPATRPVNGAPAATNDLSVAFTVNLADGQGTVQRLRKTVGMNDVCGFLAGEVPDAVRQHMQLPDRLPLSPEAQFDALARRADEFSRLGAFQRSIPLREAALLLRASDIKQHEKLMDEYQRVGMALVVPGQLFARGPPEVAERYAALRDAQWQAGLEHLEYLIRNRAINRPRAIKATAFYRSRDLAAVPTGPPRLRQFFSDVYPMVLSLEPGQTAEHSLPRSPAGATTRPTGSFTPAEIDQIEKLAWIDAFFGQAARQTPDGPHGSPVVSGQSSPALLDDDAADFLADMIVRWFPDDVFLPPSAGYIFERVPGSEQSANLSMPKSTRLQEPPAPPPTAAGLDAARVATYEHFLDRIGKCGKAPYGWWVRLARLRMQYLAQVRAGTTRPDSTDVLLKLDDLEQEYRAFKLSGNLPGPADPLLVAIARLRTRATAAAPSAVIGFVQVGVPATGPGPAIPTPAAAGKVNRVWFVPMPVRLRSLNGTDSGPRHGLAGWAAEEQLLSAGPTLDVIWSNRHVLFWQGADLVQEVFNATTAASADSKAVAISTAGRHPANPPRQAIITDVKWDGKRVWVAWSLLADPQRGDGSSGLAVIDPDGRTTRWVGRDDGLPPGDMNLLIHPIADGTVVAIGSFGGNERAWCAAVTLCAPGEPTRVNVFHTAVAVNNDPLSIDATRRQPNTAGDSAFRPTWLAACRAPAAAGMPAGPRLLLVGRDSVLRAWPLVIDLDTLTVSVTADPFTHDTGQPARQDFAGVGESFMEIHNAAVYRYQLAWKGSRLSAAPVPVPSGETTSEPFERFLPAGNSLLLLRDRNSVDGDWLRYDIGSGDLEQLEPDYLTWRDGPCTAIGFSSRFGLVGWGQRFCRLVIAPQRPEGALRRTLSPGPIGTQARFEPDEAPPADVALQNAPSLPGVKPPGGPAPPEPTLDEMAEQLDIHKSGMDRALSRLAEMRPGVFPPGKKQAISDALLPLVMSHNPQTHQKALRAFVVWHVPESEPVLTAKLQDGDPGTRWRALEALGACRDPATIPDIVRQVSKDAGPALGCLAAIGPASEPALLALLQAADPSKPPAGIIDALAMAGTSRSVPFLQAILSRHPDRRTAELTRLALEMIQQRE